MVEKGQLLIVPFKDAIFLIQLIDVFLHEIVYSLVVHIDISFSFSCLFNSGMCTLVH